MAAAMGSATTVSTVETSSSVDAATAAECVTAVEATATVEVSATAAVKVATASATEVAPATEISAPVKPVPVIVKVAASAEVPVVEAPSAVKAAAEPRPRADEDAVREPIRPVVAIRRARVWVISIVAVRAHRRTVYGGGVHRAAYSYAHRKSLRMCEACREQADA